MNDYKTIKIEAQDEVVIKKSHFIGYAKPVQTAEEAMEFVNKIKKMNHSATHNVFAYVLKDGVSKRYSDDGEPQGTAGVPMLDVITKEGIVDCAVVVTRYFGGILLGTGGLVRAYTEGAKIALSAAQIIKMTSCKTGEILCDYTFYGKLNAFLGNKDVEVVGTDFADNVCLKVKMQAKDFDEFKNEVFDMSHGRFSCEEICEEFCEWTGEDK